MLRKFYILNLYKISRYLTKILWKIILYLFFSPWHGYIIPDQNFTKVQFLDKQLYLDQFGSVSRLFLTLRDCMDHSTPGLPVPHQLSDFTQTHVHWVGDAIQPSHPLYPLLLLPSIPPSIRVFSNESALHIRWPKYWSFSFNISPSNEHPGLIFFRMD